MKEKIQNERRKHDFYKTLFDNTYEAIIIIDIENNAKIIDVNIRAIEMFGYSFDEFTSLSLYDLSTDSESTKQRITNDNCDIGQTYYKRKNGSLIPVIAKLSRLTFDERYLMIMVICDLTEVKKKEDALRESEIKYRAIVEDQVELICRFTPDGNLTFVNTAYCKYFNKDYKELIGKPFMDLILDEDKEFVKNSFKIITKNVPYNHYDHKVTFPNGEVKWIHWSDRAIFDANGTIKEYQSIGFDITDRKELEEKLICSRMKYRAILDNLQDGFYQTDKDGTICFISNSALELLGFIDRKDIVGTFVGNYFLYPNGRAEFLERLHNAGGKLYDQEVYLVNRFKEVMIVSVNAQIIYDEDGSFAGSQGIIRNITDHKLRMSEITRLYNVVEGSQNGLVVIELDGVISYANQATLNIARSPESVTTDGHVIGKHIKTFMSLDPPNTIPGIWKILEKEDKWFGPAYVFCACSHCSRIPVDVMFSRIKDNENKSYVVASFYDTTEYRRMENKIREQSRMYEELQQEMNNLVSNMNVITEKRNKNLTILEAEFSKSLNDFPKIVEGISDASTN